MRAWQAFLDSLSTKGGNILVAAVLMLALGFALLFHNADDYMEVRMLLISTFSGFAGALLAMLKGDASRQQMIDRRSADSGNLPPSDGGADA